MISPHIFVFIWIGLFSVLANFDASKKSEIILGKEEVRYKKLFSILLFLPIIYLAGIRGYIADTTAYILKYLDMPNSFNGISAYISKVDKDVGFSIISCIIHVIFKNNYTAYLMLLAAFQGISLVNLYRKYSSNYVLSIFLFVASVDYYSWMFNGLRQFTAVTIMLFATPYFIDSSSKNKLKNNIIVILVILLASTCHQSALLMLIFVWLARGKAWNSRTLIYIFVMIAAVFFVDRFTGVLDNMLESTQYTNVVTDYTEMGDDGTNPLRVLVYAVPTIFALISKKHIRECNDPLVDFCTNMSIVSTGLYIVSMFTSGIFIGRLPIYCSLYGYILLPWEIEHMFSKKFRVLVYLAMIVLYLVFYVYQMHFVWSVF